jgi:hypothetical protein
MCDGFSFPFEFFYSLLQVIHSQPVYLEVVLDLLLLEGLYHQSEEEEFIFRLILLRVDLFELVVLLDDRQQLLEREIYI